MKKVLESFDPRKSYKGAGPKDKNNIFVIGVDNDGYTPENLSQALVAAAKLASSGKEADEVSVILPPLDITVKGALTIPRKVVLVGQVESSRGDNAVPEKRSGTRLILSPNAYISQGGGFGELRNLLIQLPSMYEPDEKVNAAAAGILIPFSATLAIIDCIFQVDDGDKPVGERLGAHVLGVLNVKGCFFNAVRLLYEVSSSGSIEDSTFNNFNRYESKMPAIKNSIAISVFSQPQAVLLKNVDVADYLIGLYIEASQKCSVTSCNISGKCCAVDVCNSETTFTGCNMSSLEGRGFKAHGSATNLTVVNSSFIDSLVGLSVDESAAVKLDNCSILNSSMCGIRVEGSAVLDMTNTHISNTGLPLVADAKADGLQIIGGGSVAANKCSVKNFSGSGVICQDEHSMFAFDDIDISNNKVGGMFASEGSSIKGAGGQFNDNEGQAIAFRHSATTGDIQGAKIKGGNVGVVVVKGPICKFKDLRCEDLSDKCVFISDATITICQAHISQQNTNAVGIEVKFETDKGNIVTLQHCKTQKCKEGIRVEQVLNKKNRSNELEDGGSIGRINPGSDIESRCEIENAAFVQCDVGFYVDAARVNLKGCSFIMNKRHSLYIVNQTLRPGQNIRKEANLKVRWPNYVEPYIDNGDNVSNDHQLLTSVTKEKSFCGSADFEPMMYIATLTERIRQARTLFKSKERGGLQEARVIMRSVSHMLILFRQLPPRLLDKELNDDPDLGMFAATFKLEEDKDTPTNTLVSIKDLFTSWQSLHRTRLFDAALQALNEAFQEKQVSEELYDQCVTPLEEMQRVCFVKSKYNRRRDYLLTTARETPLTTWYFLDKESPDTEEGRRLREEVLKFLAADREDNRVHNKTNFHASWVAQWAVHVLGQSFLDSPIPDDLYLRKAWANVLLDARQAKKVLEAYEKVTAQNQQQEVDELIRFECFRMYEDMGNQLTQTQLTKLGSLLGGNGFAAAMQVGAKLFPGEGALPGFLRRVAEEAMNPESLLEPLSNIQDIANQLSRKQKERVVLAVMSHHILPDSKIEPEIYRRHGTSYETCEMCLVQKLQPWNEIKLEGCKHNHRYCRPCMKQSMSTGSQELWGICPGTTDEGKPCQAAATRREMELAGMDRELIYNIIRKRVTQTLQRLPEWRPCDAPGCIGGRSNVTKTFYSCRLCTKMITIDGGASDPTVPKRLLQGLDGSAVMRGEGVFRECYWCSVTYEKGNACSTITCSNCNKQFSMTWGPERITHRFDEEGIGPQRYVPKVAGKLWELGVFKDRKGKPLKLGQTLTETEAIEVVRRAKLQIAEYTD